MLGGTEVVLRGDVVSRKFVLVRGSQVLGAKALRRLPTVNRSARVVRLSPRRAVDPKFVSIRVRNTNNTSAVSTAFRTLGAVTDILPRRKAADFLTAAVARRGRGVRNTLVGTTRFRGRRGAPNRTRMVKVRLRNPFVGRTENKTRPGSRVLRPSVRLFGH